MSWTRRRFLRQAAPLGLSAFIPACGDTETDRQALTPCCEGADLGARFVHGVASGDPSSDAVILWTRVTVGAALEVGAEDDRQAAQTAAAPEVVVAWRLGRDPELTDIVASGTERTGADRDFTVKVDVRGLDAGTTYYYDFSAGTQRSPVGRTRTLHALAHARIAVTSCANYPAGFFNVYRRIAERADLDLVLHVGDYIYEYANGTLGDGTAISRVPDPDREIVTLDEYRTRHAQYKRDVDLQELHRQHPMIAIWDDHEVANNAFRDGALNHQPESEGSWEQRKRAAMQAYFEWMPVRPTSPGDTQRVYRSFACGDLFDLFMLDTRLTGRDARITGNCDAAGIADPARSLLGSEQEGWLRNGLRASTARGAHWRFVAQQVMFAQLSDTKTGCVLHPDQWDGYAESRARLLRGLEEDRIGNVVLLTGDAHSSWASDIAAEPFDGARYVPATGEGSLAVELVTPAVTSPGSGASVDELLSTHPHVKFAETTRRGYVLVDVTPERVQAEWYFVNTVDAQSPGEHLAAAFEVRAGENRLVSAPEQARPKAFAAPAAPARHDAQSEPRGGTAPSAKQ